MKEVILTILLGYGNVAGMDITQVTTINKLTMNACELHGEMLANSHKEMHDKVYVVNAGGRLVNFQWRCTYKEET